MGIEEQIDRLIDLGEDIKSRLDRLVKMASDHFAGANKMVAEEPAKEAEPAWEPKVGDWVKATRPENWEECKDPAWTASMHKYDGKVMQVARYEQRYGAWVANFYGHDWFFHRDWLSPAEPPEPPQPEYREPVLPADLGKWAEFSHDGINWTEHKLRGCHKECEASPTIWSEEFIGFRHCRIKVDA